MQIRVVGAVHADEGLWVQTRTDITRFDASTGEITDTIPIAAGSYAAVGQDGDLWLVDDKGSLVRIDLNARQVTNSLLIDPGHDTFAQLVPTDNSVWVLQPDGTVKVIRVP